MPRKVIFVLALLCLLMAAASVARADEIRLKDGSKVIGTIVGFENDSFRVETSYGFALIRKDKVADINITGSKQDSASSAKSIASAPGPTTTQNPVPAVAPAVAKESLAPATFSPEAIALSPMHAPAGPSATSPGTAKTEPPAPKVKSISAVPPLPTAPPPTPPAAPQPVVIRDEIRGNLYVNVTYGFQMYKPPSWELIPAARKALPDAVAALGTNDQTTLLVIGREHAKDSLDTHAAAKGKALGDVYENFRVISTRHLSVAGSPAVEQRSRGSADGRDWSVILLTLFKGGDAYTLLGMTYADSDLIQVQENVIAKAINSLTFTTP
jgi:hypothetical protein